MSAFVRSSWALSQDSFRRTWLWLGLVGLLLGAWMLWFLLAQLTLYETAPAQIEGAGLGWRERGLQESFSIGFSTLSKGRGSLSNITPTGRGSAQSRTNQTGLNEAGTSGLLAQGYFRPQAILGRIKPGQAARMYPNGFSKTIYEMLPATVISVGSLGDLRNDGTLPVRFSLALPVQAQASGFSQQDVSGLAGLSGIIEVAVEQVSPAQLAFRAAGWNNLTSNPSINSSP